MFIVGLFLICPSSLASKKKKKKAIAKANQATRISEAASHQKTTSCAQNDRRREFDAISTRCLFESNRPKPLLLRRSSANSFMNQNATLILNLFTFFVIIVQANYVKLAEI